MELTRRDAAAALVAIGTAGGIGVGARRYQKDTTEAAAREEPTDEQVQETLVAVAEVVYPGEVDGIDAFVEGFLEGRLDGSDHATGVRETVTELEALAESWHGESVGDLPVETRDQLLREVGADAVGEDPAGTTAERVRYYVVNELLLALYASPVGGELVGIENPQGHPGGTESYRRGPP